MNLTAVHKETKLLVKSPDCRMKAFVGENEKADFLIHSPDKKLNPWMEKVREG